MSPRSSKLHKTGDFLFKGLPIRQRSDESGQERTKTDKSGLEWLTAN